MKNNKAITLIALIITIIVLLILAGVIINMILGENGMISKSKAAVRKYENAQIVEEERLQEVEEYIDNNFSINKGRGEGSEIAGGQKAIGQNKKFVTSQQKAIIPEGWTLSGLENEQSIDLGLVIYDLNGDTITNWNEDTNNNGIPDVQENYNQFVWIPVSNFNEFKREHFGTISQKWWTGDFVITSASANNLYEPSADGIANTTEVEKMYKSVKEYGGFYIARYEASNNNGKAESKRNKTPWASIGWSDSNDISVETGGAIEKARAMYSNSTLCYGVQRDAIIRWFSKDNNFKGCLIDSTGRGNYETSSIINTGSNERFVMKNIYDIAGNVWEWTMERYNTDKCIGVGGSCTQSGIKESITTRFSSDTNKTWWNVGFRPSLYV